MKLKSNKRIILGICLFVSFLLWTVIVSVVDVRPIRPEASSVGLATVNSYLHDRIGVHMWLYELTDALSIIPLALVLGFAIFGLLQWIKRKRITKVDRNLLILGGYFVSVLALFLLFEVVVINYRPVLIEGALEASYPSSTTLLVLCVIPASCLELNSILKKRTMRTVCTVTTALFCAFMVTARLISGVHWVTDIIGGSLLSAALVFTYSVVG